MDENPIPRFGVSGFVELINQVLEFSCSAVEIEGEVASFKVNQGKWVFFDLKDEEASVGCFMPVYQLRTPIEDGMKLVVRAQSKVTKWGKFSVTVQNYRPLGEGSLRKSFQLLRTKLEKEGIFAAERKRCLPQIPARIGVISSTQAAGYADFIKIVNERWGGLQIDVAHVQVQGEAAADQIVAAINRFNESQTPPEVLVIIRGGGSADDLNTFNDELLVRAIAASRVPTLVGIGHEVDMTLADLAADVRASTPSNAAQIIVPDRRELVQEIKALVDGMAYRTESAISDLGSEIDSLRQRALLHLDSRTDVLTSEIKQFQRILAAYNPQLALARGYAIVRGSTKIGEIISIEEEKIIIKAEVKNVKQK
jgi:exodeoxyribonuclease VII large subunit